MKTMTLEFTLLSYWHCSTGKGEGPGADLLAIRDASGLPYVPGRTVKGLLRHAVEWLDELEGVQVNAPNSATAIFGTGIPDSGGDKRVRKLEEARHSTQAGTVRVDSAELGADQAARDQWRAWATDKAGKAMIPFLTTTVASTRMNEFGVAQDRTLRMVEVVVPLTLFAELESDEPGHLARIEQALPLLRELGTGRNRGFGRVHVSVRK